MRLVCLLSKEHKSLPRAEVEAVLRSLDVDFSVRSAVANLLLVETNEDFSNYTPLSRLAMTREVGRVIDSISYQQLAQGLKSASITDGLSQEKSFAVRSQSVTRQAPSDLETKLGSVIKEETGSTVDLKRPDVTYRVYCLQEEMLLARVEVEIDRSQYERRRNQHRPFSHPTSLHPRLARTMVNLAEVKGEDRLLDPFAGTGGILIEAGLIGCQLYGADISQEMIEGAKTNLRAYGLENFQLKRGDVKQLPRLFPEQKFAAIVTDTPYGRASKKVGKALNNFIDQLERFEESKVVFMSHKPEVNGWKADFSIYVHKNLTKYLYCLD